MGRPMAEEWGAGDFEEASLIVGAGFRPLFDISTTEIFSEKSADNDQENRKHYRK